MSETAADDDSPYTYEIACEKLPDGSLFLSDVEIQLAGPEAVAFINRMSNYWQRHDKRCGWVTAPWKILDA